MAEGGQETAASGLELADHPVAFTTIPCPPQRPCRMSSRGHVPRSGGTQAIEYDEDLCDLVDEDDRREPQ